MFISCGSFFDWVLPSCTVWKVAKFSSYFDDVVASAKRNSLDFRKRVSAYVFFSAFKLSADYGISVLYCLPAIEVRGLFEQIKIFTLYKYERESGICLRAAIFRQLRCSCVALTEIRHLFGVKKFINPGQWMASIFNQFAIYPGVLQIR